MDTSRSDILCDRRSKTANRIMSHAKYTTGATMVNRLSESGAVHHLLSLKLMPLTVVTTIRRHAAAYAVDER